MERGERQQALQDELGGSLVQRAVVVAALGRLDAGRAAGAAGTFGHGLERCVPQLQDEIEALLRDADASWVSVVDEYLRLAGVRMQRRGDATDVGPVAHGEEGQHPDGRQEIPAASDLSGSSISEEQEAGYTCQEALRTKSFWLITMGHACSSIVIITLMVHLGPMLTDRGFSLQAVGWIVALYTGVGAVFTLVGGYIGDRVPIRWALFGFSVVQSSAVIVLLEADTGPGAYLFAVLLGIGFGGRAPLTTAIRGVYFGRRAFASIMGVSMIPMNIMLLVAPLFAGIMFDKVGSYEIPFVTIAVISFIGAALFLFLGDPVKSPNTGGQERG